MIRRTHLGAIGLLLCAGTASAQVLRVWLSHQAGDPSRLTISCQTAAPQPVKVRAWREGGESVSASDAGRSTIHHLEVPFRDEGAPLRYEVNAPGRAPLSGRLRASPVDALRIAVVANWGYASKPDLAALRRDAPHLLLTAGDNVRDQHSFNGIGDTQGTKAYEALIDSQPELFRSTPFLPVLGNHDHQIRPRGPKPPAEPVYDIEAAAFRRFFALPEPRWRWRFDLPRFGLRLLALDLHHTSDFGTTWQTGHPFGPASDQQRWFDRNTSRPVARFTIALQNERNSTVRGLPGWAPLLARCTAVIAGFGYFAERALPPQGAPSFNTSLKGTGDRYPDPDSRFLASEDNYLLLSLPRDGGPMRVEIKSLDGRVLDRADLPGAR